MQPQGVLVWLTGYSGAGKSTIAETALALLQARGRLAYVLDGDRVRKGLCSDLGFSREDRAENVRRIAEAGLLMADAGVVVLAAVIAPFRVDRDRVRARAPRGRFLEAFVDTPLDVCEARDPKGLYKMARKGLLQDFTGIDSPYESPLKPDIALRTTEADANALAATLVDEIMARTSG
ncbi:MAG: adenylyl-sulfate kinase [Deltaproteobacteria bacterium]|nr:adenylyl-sulfate kinase [Deltaproteobacteria bacterium]MBK8236863.1 adenylyl-sulfate kinase [Deltaproteobacteria bacterium]MBK8719075.1 adenylyl-sulfate kinase [Deltaproteobacteria bacterium]MBP7287990.1 adenylyl-sulfate kinase [Nannocystaceae bacterium]